MNAAIILAAIIGGATAAHANDGTAVRSVVGPWRLSAVGGKVGCTLLLTDRKTSGGNDLQAPAACQRAFPLLKGLSEWTLDARGALMFSDPARTHVIDFSGPSGGPYAAIAPDGRVWRLAAAATRTPAALTP
jgi:hypothetical protein